MRQANLPLHNSKALPSVQLIHGDCLEVMPTLPAGSVQMVFADLPYGCTQAHWDARIDLPSLWQSLQHVSRHNGPYIFTAQQPFLTTLIASRLNEFRYDLVWQKNRYAGFMLARKAPLRAHETVAVFGSTQIYNPQMTVGHKPYLVSAGKRPHKCVLNGAVAKTKTGGTQRFPISVQKFSRDDKRDGNSHPTQKPVALMEWLITTYTDEGDTVLDPTAGSMTTAIAALRTGRNAICIEKDAEYFCIGSERVRAEQGRLSQMG